MIKIHLKKQLEKLIKSAQSNAVKEKMLERFEEQKKYFMLNYEIGEIFILVSNEWNKLRIVEVVGYETFGKKDQMPLPLVRDISSSEIFVSFAVLIPFSINTLIALKKLNPFERYAISTKQTVFDNKEKNGDYDLEKTTEELIIEYNEYLAKKTS